MTNYVPIVTVAGRAADQASKIEGNPAIRFSQMLIGDGNGATPAPTDAWTQLVNQRAAIPVTSVAADPQDPTKLWVTAEVQQNTPRGYTIREIALTLDTGTLYCVAACPDTAMPMASEGAMRLPVFKIPFILTPASGVITVFENPGQYATEQWVTNLFNTLAVPSIPEFATIPEHLAGVLETKKTHPKGVKAMIDAMLAYILPLIPPVFTQSATAPVLWDGGTRVISSRPATKTLTGHGRVATDAEAAAGLTDPNAVFSLPWMTPEQVKALFTALTTEDDFAVGTTLTLTAFAGGIEGSAMNPFPAAGTILTGANLAAAAGAAASFSFSSPPPGSWKLIVHSSSTAHIYQANETSSWADGAVYSATFKRIS